MGNRVCRIDEAAKKLRAKLSEARDSSKIEDLIVAKLMLNVFSLLKEGKRLR